LSKVGFKEIEKKKNWEGDMSLLSKPSYYNARHGSKEDIQTCALETSCLGVDIQTGELLALEGEELKHQICDLYHFFF